MKAKTKKIALALLVSAVVAAGAAALAGCNKGGSEHTHEYGAEWSFNDTHHFHKCTDEDCNSVSGSQEHQQAERESATATCTEAGVKTTYCTVEGCNWTKTEAQAALGHDWDYANAECEETHLLGLLGSKVSDKTVSCKRDGCTATDKQPNSFTERTIGRYTVYTCSDCGTELAEVKVNVLKRVSDTRAEAYTDATLKVSLHKIGDGNYTKVYEATADPDTGVATFLVREGAYWIKIEDETNGWLSVDSPWIRYDSVSAKSDNSWRDVILSEPAEYTLQYLYDVDRPAEGLTVTVYELYKYSGPGVDSEPCMILGEGVTDENGEVTFTLASSFDKTNTNAVNLSVHVSNIDEAYTSDGLGLFIDHKNTTSVRLLRPKQLAYNIKINAYETGAAGVGVKLTKQEYDQELGEFVDREVTSGVTDENGEFATEILDNRVYKIWLTLTDELAENFDLPYYIQYTNGKSEIVIDLVGKPAYNLTVTTTSTKTWEKSGIKLVIKDTEGNTVTEGTTDEEGKLTVRLELAEYKVYIDEDTLPEGFGYGSAVTLSTSRLDKVKNTINCDVTIGEIVDVDVVVEIGTEGYENVTVKFYKDGELAFESAPIDGDGATTIKGLVGEAYDVVLEGAPENCVYTNKKMIIYEPVYGNDLYIKLNPSAKFALTLKDGEGNALEGATVSLVTYSYAAAQDRWTVTAVANGVTDANGFVSVDWLTGKTYAVNVVGADGTKYFAQVNLTSSTQGEVLTRELTVYPYDVEIPQSGSRAPKIYYTGDLIDKETLVSCSGKRDEQIGNASTTGQTLSAGTYRFEISNPCNVAYKVTLKCGYANWAYVTITKPNEYMTFEKDASGNITSVTVNFDNSKQASWFDICIGHDVADGEVAADLFRLLVKVTKVA